jgi:hypothetical protein
MGRTTLGFVLAAGLLLVLPLLLALLAPPTLGGVDGVVLGPAGPVAGARVRWQGKAAHAISDARGHFRLTLPGAAAELVTASKPGYLIATAAASQGPLRLTLAPLPEDNEHYAWVSPHPGVDSAQSCGNCHGAIYREWAGSAHARSARNPRFLDLLDGGTPPRKSWNVRAENPLGAGVCAVCHAPTLSSPSLDYDVRAATGVAADGVHCDYCHKIADAPTDRIGTRFGRDGLRLVRPAPGHSLSFGPLDDAVRSGEAFAQLPLYRESRYCASCHEGVVFGVHAYGTYSEWLDSPARRQGRQCQDCHMAPSGTMTNIAPGHGGLEREPRTLASHGFAASTAEMLQRCLELEATVHGKKGRVDVEVSLRARLVGHRVPTGFVDRHLLLVVTATDAQGEPAPLLDGPRLPLSAGEWSGSPGWLYAKQLTGEGGRAPIPFWLPVAGVQDTRLVPEQADRRRFSFAADAVKVSVRLWYRRFWPEVAEERSWQDNETLLFTRELLTARQR